MTELLGQFKLFVLISGCVAVLVKFGIKTERIIIAGCLTFLHALIMMLCPVNKPELGLGRLLGINKKAVGVIP